MAEPYRRDIDFAFFAVEFGYTKQDYMSLTPREIAFVKKAWEDKTVRDSELLHKAVLLAEYNVNRGRRKYRRLWEKKRQQPVDPVAKDALFQEVLEQEQKKGLGWLDKVLGRSRNG